MTRPPDEKAQHGTTARYELDFEKYAPYLSDADISEADQRALLETLWSLVLSFVRLGYGLSSEQLAIAARANDAPACGQLPKTQDHGAIRGRDQVKCEGRVSQRFVAAAEADDEKGISP